jgi:hypothetical protein
MRDKANSAAKKIATPMVDVGGADTSIAPHLRRGRPSGIRGAYRILQ